MNIIKKRWQMLFLTFIWCISISILYGQQACPVEPGIQCPINNGLLIFLDDSESDMSPGQYKIGFASNGFLGAFLQQAGPIIVSASILDNVKEYQKPKEKDPALLIERYNTILKAFPNVDDNSAKEIKSIILSAISFNHLGLIPRGLPRI